MGVANIIEKKKEKYFAVTSSALLENLNSYVTSFLVKTFFVIATQYAVSA